MTAATANAVLALLRRDAGATEWGPLLDPAVRFEALGKTLAGRDATAAQLGGTRFAHLAWSRLDRPGIVLAGSPAPDTRDRGLVLSIATGEGGIVGVAQQNMAMPPHPAAPMRMDAALRDRIDTALAGKHPISLAYVDASGRPHLSLRGSLRSIDEARLVLWARSAETGLAAAVRINPHVALLYRDEAARATYQLEGRAIVADDEEMRDLVFAGLPAIEQQHDFARLGAAIVIELDRVEGYAGLGPAGQIDPVRLIGNAGN